MGKFSSIHTCRWSVNCPHELTAEPPPRIQFYRRHHDSSDHKNNAPTGHRILTFFLYLNDVEEGGETRFTTLGIDVKPKKVN